MMKKFTALLTAAAVAISLNVYAKSEITVERIDFSPVERSLTVSGSCTEVKDKCQVLEQITDENGAVAAAEQSETRNGRFYIEKYLLPDNLKVGEYAINISIRGGENLSVENAFYYGGTANAIRILNLIDQSTSVGEIDGIINENHKALGFADYNIYSKCTSKKMLLEGLIDMDFSADENNCDVKWQSLLDILSKNTLLAYFSDTTSAEDIEMLIENEEYLKAMGMEQSETYKKLTDEGKKAAYEIIASESNNTLDGVYTTYKKGSLLAFLRNCRYTEVETALRENPDIADVSYSVYNGLSQEQKNEVMRNTAVYAQSNGNIDDICRYFESEAKKESESGSGSGLSGGNSGGSGGGGSSGGGSSSGYAYGGAAGTSVGNTGAISGASVNFTDLDSVPWAYEAITALANKGVLAGVGNGMFAPDDSVTRAQFSKMVCECFGINAEGNAEFNDVSKDSWYYGYVTKLANAGIINGVGNGNFEPDGLITRQDMSVMLVRIINKMNYAIPKTEQTETFSDDADIADYAKSSVYELVAYGILTGTDGKAMPQDNATRAQAAALIYRTEVARWKNGN